MAFGETLDNIGTSSIVANIHRGITLCEKGCKAPLSKRRDLLAELANGWYDEQATAPCPMNMIARAVNLLTPLLVSKCPKAMTRARIAQLAPYAETLRLTLNHLIRKIKLEDTVRMGVLEALCYMSIFKTGIAVGGSKVPDAFGNTHDNGEIFCDLIYPEDYFFDITARRREEVDFEGNWFYVPYEFVMDSGLYKNTEFLKDAYTNFDKLSPKKISTKNLSLRLNSLKPYVKLAEVWIPGENIVVTIPPKGCGNKPLRVVDYNGPIGGPYDTMAFNTFSESIIPVSPLYIGLDLHYYINTMARKMAREADAAKTVFPYQGNAADDAERVINAPHLQAIKVNDINAFTTLKLGEISDSSYKWVEWLKGLWSEFQGNANLLQGIQAQSPTLGQDQMLQANATASIDDMQQSVHNTLKSILTKMAHYIFTDPLMDVTVSKRKEGIGEIPVRVTRDSMRGDFYDYNFDVEPYSMVRMNPNIRMQKLMQLATGLILPTLQYAQAQGVTFDTAAFVKNIGRDLDLSDGEIDSFYKSALTNLNPGPYLPMKNSVGGVGDMLGASPASQDLNLIQQQNRAAGESSPPNAPNAAGE
jgi:hypothetical protein